VPEARACGVPADVMADVMRVSRGEPAVDPRRLCDTLNEILPGPGSPRERARAVRAFVTALTTRTNDLCRAVRSGDGGEMRTAKAEMEHAFAELSRLTHGPAGPVLPKAKTPLLRVILNPVRVS